MKLVTWNVNSVKTRLARTKGLLLRHRPDVLALQELKVSDELFPSPEFQELGYRVAVHGEAGRNGVALLSRGSMADVAESFAGDPIPDQARVVAATIDGIRVVNLYVVNGRAVGTSDYALKLRWLDALGAWIRAEHDARDPLLIVGDFNVAPEDRDVHDPELWRGSNLCSGAERERVGDLLDWGLVDLLRMHQSGPGPFTWWDYRAGAFHRGWGLRIDLALGTSVVAERCTEVLVDRDERKPTFGEGKPSDHAPLVVNLR
jgi:exodeoxyribonuclease III